MSLVGRGFTSATTKERVRSAFLSRRSFRGRFGELSSDRSSKTGISLRQVRTQPCSLNCSSSICRDHALSKLARLKYPTNFPGSPGFTTGSRPILFCSMRTMRIVSQFIGIRDDRLARSRLQHGHVAFRIVFERPQQISLRDDSQELAVGSHNRQPFR